MYLRSHINVQFINDYKTKVNDHNRFLEDFRDKNRIFRSSTISKKYLKIYFYERYQLDFLHKFSLYKI